MRFYFMDTARIAFMFSVILFHIALIFSATYTWRITNPSHNIIFDYLAFFLHSFHMHGFFIVSGFFSGHTMSKKNENEFMKDRLIRIGLPLITIGFTLNYIMNLYTQNIEYDFLSLNYYVFGEWLGHLWFLGNLLTYSFILYILIQKKIPIIWSKKYPVFQLYLLGIVFQLLAIISGKLFSMHFLIISTFDLIQYFPYFLFGYVLYNHQSIFSHIDYQKIKIHVFFSLVLSILLVYMKIHLSNEVNTKPYQIFFILCESYLSISLSLGLIALFKFTHFFNSASDFASKLSDASYTMYLLHQPFVIVLFYFLAPFKNPIIAYVFMSVATLTLTYLIHQKVIRTNKHMSFLINGNTKFNSK